MKKQTFDLRGMIRDMAASKGSSQYAFEIRNLRLTAQEDSTLLALTTEKGNTQYTLKNETGVNNFNLRGDIVGYCTVGTNYLVLFTHTSDDGDFIYRLEESTNNRMVCKELYGSTIGASKDLGFTSGTTIEAIGIYENENIQKVYWIDGVNQPRVINVVADITTITSWGNSSICPFDFTLKMSLTEEVIIDKVNAYGNFPAGTVQYICCYRGTNNQVTNPFYISPLYYLEKNARGVSPDGAVNTAFSIAIDNLDPNFLSVVIYSIVRTSINGTPICSLVSDTEITPLIMDEGIKIYDTNLNSTIVDYSEILYLGGANIIPYTMGYKDNTLFFGNIKDRTFNIPDTYFATIRNGCTITFTNGEPVRYLENSVSGINYISQLDKNMEVISTFMSGESYYFGLCVQDKHGQWSNVIPLNINSRITNNTMLYVEDFSFWPTKVLMTLTDSVVELLQELGGVNVKLVRLKENPSIVCQGIISPTLYNSDRVDLAYSQSSWFFRTLGKNAFLKNAHDKVIDTNWSLSDPLVKGEIQSAETQSIDSGFPVNSNLSFGTSEVFVDWNFLTFHSPDIYFDNVSAGDYSLSLIGCITIDESKTSMFATTSEPAYNGQTAGVIPYTPTVSNNGDFVLISPWQYEDHCWATEGTAKFPVYTWHRNGPLGDANTEIKYGMLGTKNMATSRMCGRTRYFGNSGSLRNINISELKIYEDDGVAVRIAADTNDLDHAGDKIYKAEVDAIATSNSYRLYNDHVDSTHPNPSVSNTPVHIKYKSTKHGVFSLKYTNDHKQVVLPKVTLPSLYDYQFWSNRRQPDNPSDYYTSLGINSSAVTIKTIVYLPSARGNYISQWNGYSDRWIFLRKGIVDMYGQVNIGDYIILHAPGIKADFGPGINYFDQNIILKRVGYNASDPGNNPPNPAYQNTYYCFLYYFGTGTGDFGDNTPLYLNINSGIPNSDFNKAGRYGMYAKWINPNHFEAHNIRCVAKTDISNTLYHVLTFPQITELSLNSLDNYIYLASLKRNRADIVNFENHTWINAGNAQTLSNDFAYLGTIGDAFFQRFECLKTYPFNNEDQNQVVEIMSFMCETRINIDGRYDSNFNLVDNTNITEENFNLLNDVYSQEDNMFTYAYLDKTLFNVNDFPNRILWTGTKIYGGKADQWTHVIATSVLDMDGGFGKISSIKLWNDHLLCFQDKALARIQYNDRTAISTTAGVPIELANSEKVEGKTYISTNIGCSNKESIQITQKGLYFADSNTKEIYRYSGELQSLSKSKGFNTYFYNLGSQFNTIKTFYDPKLKDVYFKTKIMTLYSSLVENTAQGEPTQSNRSIDPNEHETLVFNEQLEEFTSFFDYDMKFMFDYKGSLISIKNNTLWKQFAGDYLSFFGVDKPYSIELLCSENPLEDKTFTNFEFKADVFNNNTPVTEAYNLTTANVLPFDKIRAWNEYQNTGEVDLVKTLGIANISQKFRIWRGDIPRAYNSMDRIRNNWMKLKFKKTSGVNYKTIIHNVSVSYV